MRLSVAAAFAVTCAIALTAVFESAASSRPLGAMAEKGLYVSLTDVGIYAYRLPNRKNGPAQCESPFSIGNTLGIAVDRKGNLIVPTHTGTNTNSIIVEQGPSMCGSQLATMNDPYGLPTDVASLNADTGKIAVGNFFGIGSCGSGPCPGSIAICTLAAGCTTSLTNREMYNLYGVAMDEQGGCWGSATNAPISGGSTPTLTYFAHCTGGGVTAKNYRNSSDGGVEIDKSGNIIAIARVYNAYSAAYVYSGCKPVCTLIGGPFPLKGTVVYGHLNRKGDTFAAANVLNGSVDFYAYTPSSLTYEYSITNGITTNIRGVAYDPR